MTEPRSARVPSKRSSKDETDHRHSTGRANGAGDRCRPRDRRRDRRTAVRRGGSGRIVNVISDAARVGEPNVALYAAAKAAVAGFSRALAKEVGPRAVTVNCVSLSTTRTPGAFATFDESQIARMTRFYPLGRLG